MSLEGTYRSYQKSRRKRRNWAADNPGNLAIRAELFGCVFDLAGEHLAGSGKILDVGCGGGWLLEQLARHDVAPRRLHGVDLLEARVNAARKRLPEADICLADASDLPYPNDEFELATLLTCLSSMPDRDSAKETLTEAKRVLAPGGLLLCYEPRVGNPFNRATLHVSRHVLRGVLGSERESYPITGFPPVARRFGPLTPRLYPWLTRVAPTHRLGVWTL